MNVKTVIIVDSFSAWGVNYMQVLKTVSDNDFRNRFGGRILTEEI
jgi:hypothetical protein